MSIKNQSRLAVFASLIIGVTVAALFGMNFLIDRISKTKPPSMAVVMPPPALLNRPSADDSLNTPPPAHSGDDMAAPEGMDNKQGLPGGSMRRVNNGKSDAPMEKRSTAAPTGARGMAPNGMPAGMPPSGPPQGMPPGGMGNGYYPPPPPNMDPQQRELMEQEMERRRQMFQNGPPEGYGPPPGYYPPPMPEYMGDPYDGAPGPYYNGPEDYYDYDYESKNEYKSEPALPQHKAKLADLAGEVYSEDLDDEDELNGPEDFLEDEYLHDYLDDF